MNLELQGRSFLVAGGSSGLGFATAAALVDEGARVTVNGRNSDTLELARAELGSAAQIMVADNGQADQVTAAVALAARPTGHIDGVLVSVGGPPAGSALATSDELWEQAFRTIFLGALRVARACVPFMSGGGAIAFVLSSSVRTPIPNLAISNGLRPGLAMAAKTLADELGPRGIRVLGLAPGRFATGRAAQLDAAASRARPDSEIPLARKGDPEEFGRLAAFLLSPAAGYMTGCVIPVDGGLSRSL